MNKLGQNIIVAAEYEPGPKYYYKSKIYYDENKVVS
jgi:hypothetical protein